MITIEINTKMSRMFEGAGQYTGVCKITCFNVFMSDSEIDEAIAQLEEAKKHLLKLRSQKM